MSEIGQDAVRLLRDLVTIPSYAGERDIVQYVSDWCTQCGFEFEQTEVEGHPFNVVARVGDDAEGALLFNSHLDTVPPGDLSTWERDPFTPFEQDGRLYGLGACDAKGPMAAMMSAFCHLGEKWRPGQPGYILAAVCGEERGNVGIQAEVAHGIRAGAAVVGEPTSMIPMAASKGVLRLEVTVQGRAAHASQPELGVNAIYPMTAVLTELEALGLSVRQRAEALTGHPSLVVTTIHGGKALNVIPDRCSLSIDRRLVPGETERDARAEIDAALQRAAAIRPDLAFEVSRVRGMDPAKTDTSSLIVDLARACASRALSRTVGVEGFTAACDGNFLINGAGIPTVIMGPGDLGMAHQVMEFIDLSQVELAAETYYDLGTRWASTADLQGRAG